MSLTKEQKAVAFVVSNESQRFACKQNDLTNKNVNMAGNPAVQIPAYVCQVGAL
jgi:hypothetical protein